MTGRLLPLAGAALMAVGAAGLFTADARGGRWPIGGSAVRAVSAAGAGITSVEIRADQARLTVTACGGARIRARLQGYVVPMVGMERLSLTVTGHTAKIVLRQTTAGTPAYILSDTPEPILRIDLPPSALGDLRVTDGAGDVDMTGVAARHLAVSLGQGSVTLTGDRADALSARVRREGAVSLADDRGRTDASIGDGSIRLISVTGAITADARTGTIRAVLPSVPAAVTLRTGSGDIRVNVAAVGRGLGVHASARVGRVRVRLPAAGVIGRSDPVVRPATRGRATLTVATRNGVVTVAPYAGAARPDRGRPLGV